MSCRMVMLARLNDEARLSVRESGSSSETAGSRRNGHPNSVPSHAPPSSSTLPSSTLSPSPATTAAREKPTRACLHTSHSPHSLPPSIGSVSQRRHLSPYVLQHTMNGGETAVVKSSSATHIGPSRGQRTGLSSSPASTSPNALFSPNRPASESKSATTSNQRTFTRPLRRSCSAELSRGVGGSAGSGNSNQHSSIKNNNNNNSSNVVSGARRDDRASRTVFGASAATLLQRERRETRSEKLVRTNGGGKTTATSSGRRSRSQRCSTVNTAAHDASSNDSSSTASPLLLSTVPARCSLASVVELDMGVPSTTYTAVGSSATRCASSRPSLEKEVGERHKRRSRSARRQLDAVDAPTTTAAAPASGAASTEKPWLAKPEGRGILKRSSSAQRHSDAVIVPSPPAAVAHSLSAAVPSSPPPLSSVGGPMSPLPSTIVHARRFSRHVHFDEANIQSLDASARRVIHNDSDLGVNLSNVEWGTVVVSPTTAHSYNGARRPDTGTTVSMGKAKTSAWGADSEWFNTEFGAQLEPHADHFDLSSSTLTSATLGVADSSTSMVPTSWLLPSVPSAPSGGSDALNSDVAAADAAESKQPKPRSKTSMRRKGSCRTQRQQLSHLPLRQGQLPPPTPPVQVHHHHHDAVVLTVAKERTNNENRDDDEEARGSSPVLTYDHDPLNSTAVPASSTLPPWAFNSLGRTAPPTTGASSICSSNNAFVPAPPLSVSALRSRALSAQSSPSSSHSPQGMLNGSRPRHSSPGVSFTSADFSDLNIDDDFHKTDEGVKAAAPAADDHDNDSSAKTDLSATAPPKPAPVPSAALVEDDSAESSESPSASALQLSEEERRLLRAVMHVNQPPHHPAQARSVATATGKHDASESSGGRNGSSSSPATRSSGDGGGTGALRASVRSLGDPRSELLSSGIRRFLDDGGAAERSGGGHRMPSPSCGSRPWSASSANHIKVISTPASAAPSNRTGIHSDEGAGTGADTDAGAGAGNLTVFSPNSTITSTSFSSASAESPMKAAVTPGSSRFSDLSVSHSSFPRSTGAIRGSGPDSIHVPATLATQHARRNLKQEPSSTGNAAAGLNNTVPPSSLVKPDLQRAPPRLAPAAPSETSNKILVVDSEDDDDAEPHLRIPMPTPRTTASISSTKRRKSL